MHIAELSLTVVSAEVDWTVAGDLAAVGGLPVAAVASAAAAALPVEIAGGQMSVGQTISSAAVGAVAAAELAAAAAAGVVEA